MCKQYFFSVLDTEDVQRRYREYTEDVQRRWLQKIH